MQGRPPNKGLLPRDQSVAPSLVLFDIDEQKDQNNDKSVHDDEDP